MRNSTLDTQKMDLKGYEPVPIHSILALIKELTKDDYSAPEDKSVNCVIHPKDTINWKIGEYLYDCLLITDGGEAITFISSTFKLLRALGKITDVGDNNG